MGNLIMGRRAALTGPVVSVATVAGGVAAAALPAPTAAIARWDAAFGRYQLSFAAAEASGWDDQLAASQCDDWCALMQTPAPHVEALHWKLDYLYGKPNDDGSTTQWEYSLVLAVVEDARRLANGETSA